MREPLCREDKKRIYIITQAVGKEGVRDAVVCVLNGENNRKISIASIGIRIVHFCVIRI